MQRLLLSLPQFINCLRAEGFDIGTEQYLSACDLLVVHTASNKAFDFHALRGEFSGVFCTNADEQARFPKLFGTWYADLGIDESATKESQVSQVITTAQPPTWLTATVGRWRISLAAIVITIIGAIVLVQIFTPPTVLIETQPEPGPTSSSPVDPVSPRQAKRPKIIEIPLRRPPEPIMVSARFYPDWASWVSHFWVFPVLLWVFWIVQRMLFRQVVLARRAQRKGEIIHLDQLNLADDEHDLFTTPVLAATWRYLRRFRAMGSPRLNEDATIDLTLQSGGFFHPVYRERQVPPAYLLLVDRHHSQDHIAGFADELLRTMRKEHIEVVIYYYQGDPRFCSSPYSLNTVHGPAALASHYADHDLLLVGNVDAMFDLNSGEPQPWLAEFSRWQRKYLLTPNPVWDQGEQGQVLAQVGFQLRPMTVAGFAQIDATAEPIGEDDPRDLPAPKRFIFNAGRWLEERSPGRKRLSAALGDLKRYLGSEGFILLAASAAYPALYWKLTRALDAQLELNVADRELRLRKIARLPWFRHGYLPNYLRRALLRQIPRKSYQKISGAYHALLEHRNEASLRLPIAVPQWQGLRALLREMLSSSQRHAPLADHVFASVVRGRRPRLLEFSLPANLGLPVASQRWRGLVLPIIFGLLLAPMAIWLNLWFWQQWLEPVAQAQALSVMKNVNQNTQVSIFYQPDLASHAKTLRGDLEAWDYEVYTQQQPVDDSNISTNYVSYSLELGDTAETKDIANDIATRFSYLYYDDVGPEVVEIPTSLDNANTNMAKNKNTTQRSSGSTVTKIRVVLNSAPRVFRDSLISSKQVDLSSTPPAINSDNITVDEARAKLNSLWSSDVLSFCQKERINRYPLARNSTDQITLEDFGVFFGPGGKMDNFFNTYLRDFVDTSSIPWRWRGAGGISISALAQFHRASIIKDTYFRYGGKTPYVYFSLKPIGMDSNIRRFILEIDGQKLTYSHGPSRLQKIQWPGPDGSSYVKLDFFPSASTKLSAKRFEGPWAWFRLLDQSNMKASKGTNRYSVIFTHGKLKARYELRVSSADNPFRLKALEEFRCPDSL